MTCPTCGNPVPDGEGECPFCESVIRPGSPVARKPALLKTVNIKSGLPTAAQAEPRVRREIRAASVEGHKVLKIIHGYGSTGVGGVLREMVWDLCDQLRRQGTIRFHVPGEAFDRRTEAGKRLLAEYPQLREDRDCQRNNRGITLVVLGSSR